MAITIRNITEKQIQLAKDISGKGTAASGVVACVDIAFSQVETIAKLRDQVKALEQKCNHSDAVMSRLASAADEALCIVRQRNLLQ